MVQGRPNNADSKRPAGAPSTSSRAVAKSSGGGVVKRYTGSSGGGSVNSGGIWRYYTDDAAGLKIGPTTVLVFSLCFIAFVVFLHIFGKFRR